MDCCPAGARTVGPCSHVAAILLVGCVFPTHPDAYKSTHRYIERINLCSKDQL